MKRNEIIELNGTEYTLELNRESFIQIDKICNIKKSMSLLQKDSYEYIEEIDDNYNPLENLTSYEELEKDVIEKEKTIKKLITRAFFIWLYPNHKIPISKVEEIIAPYFENEEKSEWIGEKLQYLLQQCIEIKDSKQDDIKN